MRLHSKVAGAALAAAFLSGVTARAATVASTYETININGSVSQLTGVPLAASNSTADPNATLDPLKLYITNDSQYVYLAITYANPVTTYPGLYLGIDSSGGTFSGFNDDGSGIDSNTAFANDYPFSQTSATYNTSYGGFGATYASTNEDPNILEQGVASDQSTTEFISIATDAVQTDADPGSFSGNIFPSTFTIVGFTPNNVVNGVGDDVYIGPVTYTLAALPEPVSLSLLGFAALPLMRRRAGKA